LDVLALPREGMTVRHPEPSDQPRVLAVLDRWWGGFGGERGSLERALLLPRLFFQHFSESSYLLERENGELAAFLVGFLSQTRLDESYIHFVGVDPGERGRGLARHLYRLFFAHSRQHGRCVVRAITSPGNRGSYAFHTRMGFTAEPGSTSDESRPVQPDYDGPGLDRVTFVIALDPATTDRTHER
jgi:ribosomal protein S18 acetylase RimI-like enzyme